MATAKKPDTTKAKPSPANKAARTPSAGTKPFRKFGGYFTGAWRELREVRWPSRRSTWGLTVAVMLFSLFFALVILGLDAVFSYLFKEVLL